MRTGGEETPKRAAQPLMVVRLVAFAGAALLAALALTGIGALRYRLDWITDNAEAPVALIAEMARPAPAARPRPRAPETSDAERVQERNEATASAAPGADAAPPVITAPVWIERPRNTARFYPREAFIQGVEGQVVLDCMVEADGRLNCSVASETPPDRGFGDAALAIAAAHVMQPAMRDGAPVRALYRMVIPFSTSG